MSFFLNSSSQIQNFPQVNPPSSTTSFVTLSHNIQDYYQINRIIGKKKIRGKIYYKVLWKGYSELQASWEPKARLHRANQQISRYQTHLIQSRRKSKIISKQKKSFKKKDQPSKCNNLLNTLNCNSYRPVNQFNTSKAKAQHGYQHQKNRNSTKIYQNEHIQKQLPTIEKFKVNIKQNTNYQINNNPKQSIPYLLRSTFNNLSPHKIVKLPLNNNLNDKQQVETNQPEQKKHQQNNYQQQKRGKKNIFQFYPQTYQKNKQNNLFQIQKTNQSKEKLPYIIQSKDSQIKPKINQILGIVQKNKKSRQYVVKYQQGFFKILTTEQMLQNHLNQFIVYLENKII